MAPSPAEEKKPATKTEFSVFAGKVGTFGRSVRDRPTTNAVTDPSRFSYRRRENGSVETVVDGRGCRDNSTASASIGTMNDTANEAIDSKVDPKPAKRPPKQYEVFSGKASKCLTFRKRCQARLLYTIADEVSFSQMSPQFLRLFREPGTKRSQS
jgi:hypothetical protein